MRNRTERELYERELRRENQIARENQVARENANAANGLLLGFLIALVAGLGAAFFFLNQRSATTNQEAPTQIIQPPDVNVDVPQPQAPEVEVPDVEVPEAPDVNITVPEAQSPIESEPSEAAPAEPTQPVEPPAQ